MSKEIDLNSKLFPEIKKIIEEGKQQVAQAINVSLTATYWQIGKRINEDILENKRADYGKEILHALSAKLVNEYGKGFSTRNLANMTCFAEVYPDFQIVAPLMRQLSWTHFKANIKVAEYITKHISKELLAKKLHQFAVTDQKLIENRNSETEFQNNLKGLRYE